MRTLDAILEERERVQDIYIENIHGWTPKEFNKRLGKLDAEYARVLKKSKSKQRTTCTVFLYLRNLFSRRFYE